MMMATCRGVISSPCSVATQHASSARLAAAALDFKNLLLLGLAHALRLFAMEIGQLLQAFLA